MTAATPHVEHSGAVRGEVVRAGETPRSRPGVGDLLRLAWRLGAPVVEPVLRTGAPLAAALVGPLAERTGDPRPIVSLRLDGHDQPVEPDVLGRLARDASGRVLVLVPASGGDERCWQRGVAATGATYGDRLASLLGWSPVPLRYDGGHTLSEGSLALGALLQRLVDGWPVPVTRLVLVADGDGGLLARGALGVRHPGARPWTDLVTELLALGTPGLGTTAGPGAGRRVARELAGLVVLDPHDLDVPALDHVDYLLVGDRATARPHPVGRALGGLLWWRQRPRRVHDLFATADRFEVSTVRHPMVNHPEIHEALLHRLA